MGRVPTARAARSARGRLGEEIRDTRQVNPGEVWEENEFWIELSWRIDPDGSLGIRRHHESRARPGEKLTVEEYYGWMFENSVPGLPERAAAEGLTPLEWMRRYGAFEISSGLGALHEKPVAAGAVGEIVVDGSGRAYTSAPEPPDPNIVPTGTPGPDAHGRRPIGVEVDGALLHGFPTPSGRLEFYSSTLAAWGWPNTPCPATSRAMFTGQPGRGPNGAAFHLPAADTDPHTLGQRKWLDELAHTNPVWIHPLRRGPPRMAHTGDLVRVETDIGYFVAKAWVTEGSGPVWSPAATTWAAGVCQTAREVRWP